MKKVHSPCKKMCFHILKVVFEFFFQMAVMIYSILLPFIQLRSTKFEITHYKEENKFFVTKISEPQKDPDFEYLIENCYSFEHKLKAQHFINNIYSRDFEICFYVQFGILCTILFFNMYFYYQTVYWKINKYLVFLFTFILDSWFVCYMCVFSFISIGDFKLCYGLNKNSFFNANQNGNLKDVIQFFFTLSKYLFLVNLFQFFVNIVVFLPIIIYKNCQQIKFYINNEKSEKNVYLVRLSMKVGFFFNVIFFCFYFIVSVFYRIIVYWSWIAKIEKIIFMSFDIYTFIIDLLISMFYFVHI